MKLIRQPPNSTLCGPACIATIVGVSLEEGIKLCGKAGRTNTRHLVSALRSAGFVCDGQLTRIYPGQPVECRGKTLIVKLKEKGRSGGHWVIRHKRKWYDPDAGVLETLPYQAASPTSYLQVYGCD